MQINIRNYLRSIWLASPLTIATIMIILITLKGYFNFPPDIGRPPLGDLNEAQKQAISIIVELNKFLVSIGTLMFGVLGFYLTAYRDKIQAKCIAISYFMALILLSCTYYFSFNVYSELTKDLASNSLLLTPGLSPVLYFLEMAFWTSAGSALILLFIFVVVIMEMNNKPFS